MHIMEGYLPITHAVGWTAVSAPFIAYGISKLNKKMNEDPESKLILGASGGFAFVLSALKLPSISGSSSHPTGIGLGAILFGPSIMAVMGFIVLLFQALLLAHGGITTLGANTFSMAIAGSMVAYAAYKTGIFFRLPFSITVFLAATFADLSTYIVTSLQLALAFPDPVSGFAGSAGKFLAVFAVTQIPLAIGEGILTVLLMNLLRSNSPALVRRMLLLSDEKAI